MNKKTVCRKLNELAARNKYPLLDVSDLLDQLGKCEYFTTLDLANGFHQFELNPVGIPKTAFSVKKRSLRIIYDALWP